MLLMRDREASTKDRERIQAVRIGDPAVAASSDAGEAPANVVATAKLGLLGDEQAEESLADIAEADDGKVISGNVASSCAPVMGAARLRGII